VSELLLFDLSVEEPDDPVLLPVELPVDEPVSDGEPIEPEEPVELPVEPVPEEDPELPEEEPPSEPLEPVSEDDPELPECFDELPEEPFGITSISVTSEPEKLARI
jgi:hypothetical protein